MGDCWGKLSTVHVEWRMVDSLIQVKKVSLPIALILGESALDFNLVFAWILLFWLSGPFSCTGIAEAPLVGAPIRVDTEVHPYWR